MKFLYRTYQLFIALPIGMLLTILTAIITLIGSLFNAHIFGYYPAKIWCKCILWLLFIPVKVKGRENLSPHQSYVFVANHQGSFDIFLIYGYLNRNFKWMMKKGLRHIPLVGIACEKAQHIFVDKSGPNKIKATIDHAEKTLQNGTSLFVFPEGARTFTGHMGLFRKGAFWLANELQMQVAPITINGSFDILPRQKGFNFIKWHSLELIIHKPIQPIGKNNENMKQLSETSYQAIMSGLPKYYQGYIENPDQ